MSEQSSYVEKYLGDESYELGTILVLGGEQEVTTTNFMNDKRVIGVAKSTDSANVVSVALNGRTICKVIGKVEKGDIIVTSAIYGYGVVNNNPLYGAIVGKAVGTKELDARGVVEAVLIK